MNRIQKLLRDTIGLDAASVGRSLIEQTVRSRMKSHGLSQVGDYCKILKTSASELKELIESVVVTETWFFREKESFAALAKIVINNWLPAHPVGRMRILSLPCASGEEPYSIVMTLLDAGLKPDRFEVHAVDISEQMLARAQRGVYGKNSFRGSDLGFRSRYFHPTGNAYQLDASVRRCVRFEKGNLLDPQFPPRPEVFDFIFCRNLLIYFDQEARARAVRKIEQLLAPDGLCFVGAAELPLFVRNGLCSANIPMAFACRKRDERRVPSGENKPEQPPDTGCPTPATLSDARRLADEGKLSDAARICQTHIQMHGPSAAAFYLLGLVHDAGDDPARAEGFYKKALYLEPNHQEALLQLAQLKEKDGDMAAARLLRRRARLARAADDMQAKTARPDPPINS